MLGKKKYADTDCKNGYEHLLIIRTFKLCFLELRKKFTNYIYIGLPMLTCKATYILFLSFLLISYKSEIEDHKKLFYRSKD